MILVCAAVTIACSKSPSAPPPPSMTPGPVETITGNERLGWDQRAADAPELATFRYAIYVDGTRSELTGTTCATASNAGSFACTARLPSLSAGAHTIELASFIVDGSVLESARSGPLRVTVGVTAPADGQVSPLRNGEASDSGERVKYEPVVQGVERPTDLAFAPDGRLFIAEESGGIRIVHPGQVRVTRDAADNHIHAIAIALDPQFERTHFVYTLSAARSRDGAPTFTLARFREVAGTFGDRIVLLGDVRASTSRPSGALRFGPDGKLFVAFDAGADPNLANDLASFNGKVLRLNPSGTTPDDQAGASPVYSLAYHAPKGFDWDPATGVLWVVEAAGDRLSAVAAADGSRKRGVTKTTLALPADSDPSSLVAYRGNRLPSLERSLLIASYEGQYLLRVRLDRDDATRVRGMDRLLHNRIGGIRAVTMGPDATVYVATDSAIYRLIP